MSIQIPTIDFGRDSDDAELIEQLQLACEQWGFFQITGHGVSPALRAKFFQAMGDFFALPKQSKLAVSRSELNFWGYYDKELTKNKRDAKEIFDIDANLSNLRDQHRAHSVPWPSELPDLESTVVEWLQACEQLSQNLLAAICTAMEQPADSLTAMFEKSHSSFLRFNYYPTPSDKSASNSEGYQESALGIHPHTDAGALTLLVQDEVAGLQVRKKDTWHTVVPADDAFIVNIGDMMQVWSNDRFVAPEHRVLASADRARLSAPYFYNPAYDAVCSPLTADENSSHYKPVNWSEFRSGRAAGDYADQGEEIQISWFRK